MKLQFSKKEDHDNFYSLFYKTDSMTLTTVYKENDTYNALVHCVPGKTIEEKHSCHTIRVDFNANGYMTNLFLVTDTGLTLNPNNLDISEKQKQKIWSDFFEGIEALREEHGPKVVLVKDLDEQMTTAEGVRKKSNTSDRTPIKENEL